VNKSIRLTVPIDRERGVTVYEYRIVEK